MKEDAVFHYFNKAQKYNTRSGNKLFLKNNLNDN